MMKFNLDRISSTPKGYLKYSYFDEVLSKNLAQKIWDRMARLIFLSIEPNTLGLLE